MLSFFHLFLPQTAEWVSSGILRKSSCFICSCFQVLLFPWGSQNQESVNCLIDNSNLSFISINHHILANFCPSLQIVDKVGVTQYGHLTNEGKWRGNEEVQEVCPGLSSNIAENGSSISWPHPVHFAGRWLLWVSPSSHSEGQFWMIINKVEFRERRLNQSVSAFSLLLLQGAF